MALFFLTQNQKEHREVRAAKLRVSVYQLLDDEQEQIRMLRSLIDQGPRISDYKSIDEFRLAKQRRLEHVEMKMVSHLGAEFVSRLKSHCYHEFIQQESLHDFLHLPIIKKQIGLHPHAAFSAKGFYGGCILQGKNANLAG